MGIVQIIKYLQVIRSEPSPSIDVMLETQNEANETDPLHDDAQPVIIVEEIDIDPVTNQEETENVRNINLL